MVAVRTGIGRVTGVQPTRVQHCVVSPFMTRAGTALKSVLNAIAGLLFCRWVGGYRLAAALWPARKDALFQGYSELVSLWPA